MKHCFYHVLFCFVLGMCLSIDASGASAQNGKSVLMVVPARYHVLQLAFDMHKLRSVSLVSYRGEKGTEHPLLHMWDGTNWQYLSLSDFSQGRFPGIEPDIVILLGADNTTPSVLLNNINYAGWGCDLLRVKTIDMARLINSLNSVFQFQEKEWDYLSRRFELDLINLDQNKQPVNPYEIRRSELPFKNPEGASADDSIAPAVVTEDFE